MIKKVKNTNKSKYPFMRSNIQWVMTKSEMKIYKHRMQHRKYMFRLEQATYNESELPLIKEFKKNCPKGFDVDHIIPLKNDNVCGLHTMANLQYMDRSENYKKLNKFDINEYNELTAKSESAIIRS